MSVQLEIGDGDPWWLSPNVWAVPGNDPEGPPGTPVVDQPCFLHARVSNAGRERATDATVRFYWANPAVGFDRTTANLIGISYISIDPGKTADVLCLTPWTPIFVNEGHECVLAEAFHPSLDPLPTVPAFNVPTDRHVAQRNLSVVHAVRGRFHLAFEVHNPGRKECRFGLSSRQGRPGELESLLPTLGRDFRLPKGHGGLDQLCFVHAPCPDEHDKEKHEPVIEELALAPRQRNGLALVGRLEGEGALVHVLQRVDERIVGGLSVLVLPERPRRC